ncbi:hypothetical protein C8R45DRAFT_975166 [Mycena sanguinolenta]|nr:hypothetical protein C8R45DRAFT_975166 [Mycena sanguinolenta]
MELRVELFGMPFRGPYLLKKPLDYTTRMLHLKCKISIPRTFRSAKPSVLATGPSSRPKKKLARCVLRSLGLKKESVSTPKTASKLISASSFPGLGRALGRIRALSDGEAPSPHHPDERDTLACSIPPAPSVSHHPLPSIVPSTPPVFRTSTRGTPQTLSENLPKVSFTTALGEPNPARMSPIPTRLGHFPPKPIPCGGVAPSLAVSRTLPSTFSSIKATPRMSSSPSTCFLLPNPILLQVAILFVSSLSVRQALIQRL